MTAPADKPAGWSVIDDYIPRKSTPTDARTAFARLTEDTYHPHLVNISERDALMDVLANLAGLDMATCKPQTTKNLRAAAKLLIENKVTLAEAQEVVSSMDAKSLAWYKTNGSPHGAATKIIDEVSRLAAKESSGMVSTGSVKQDAILAYMKQEGLLDDGR